MTISPSMKPHMDSNSYYAIGELVPGQVNLHHFMLLISVSGIRSQNICRALEDVFVYGKTRKDACFDNHVTQSNLSIKYQKIQSINYTVIQMYPYILPEKIG